MKLASYRITLNINRSASCVSLGAQKGETARRLYISLAEDGKPYSISKGCYAVLSGTKPDGTVLFNDCVVDGDVIIYDFTPQTTNVVGCVKCEIRLYGADGMLLISTDFEIIVHNTATNEQEIIASETEVEALTELISQAIAANDNANNAAENAQTAVENASAAADNANTATEEAANAAGDAKSAAEHAKAVAESAILCTEQTLSPEQQAQARENIGAAKVAYITPQMYGAVGDGTTDDTAAIQAMFDDAAGEKKVYFPVGNYLTTTTIDVPLVPDIEMDGMIKASHTGNALVLGQAAVYNMNKCVKVKLIHSGSVHDGSIGLVVGAFARSTFYLAYVTNFSTNVRLSSNGGKGIFFNTFYIDDLNGAQVCLDLDGTGGWIDGTSTEATGWINDNLFIGGSLVRGTADTTGIQICNGNNNVFLKPGLEGAGTSAHIIYGERNTFINARCESSTVGLRVDNGRENTMTSNYGNPVFENKSDFSTSGIIIPGIRNVCTHTAFLMESIDQDKFFTVGGKICTEYFQWMSSSGVSSGEVRPDAFTFADGAMEPTLNYRAMLAFDTATNKRFEFPGGAYAQINVYDANGRVELTADNYNQYVKVDWNHSPYTTVYYGKGIQFGGNGFVVSDDVIKVEIVYLGTISRIAIRTEYPCKPIGDEILTVSALPSNGYIGARVIYNGTLYIYNGTEWKAV